MRSRLAAVLSLLLVVCGLTFAGPGTGPGIQKPESMRGGGSVIGMGDRADIIVNGNFEAGIGVGWTESSTGGWDLVVDSTGRPWEPPPSGTWYAWHGGATLEDTVLSQSVVLPAGASATLNFSYYITSSDIAGYDFGWVAVDGVHLVDWDLADVPTPDAWIAHPTIDLSAYCDGAVHVISFETSNDSSSSSSLILDDVVLDDSLGGAQAIPTLSTWGMILFLLGLAGASIVIMRRMRLS